MDVRHMASSTTQNSHLGPHKFGSLPYANRTFVMINACLQISHQDWQVHPHQIISRVNYETVSWALTTCRTCNMTEWSVLVIGHANLVQQQHPIPVALFLGCINPHTYKHS